MSAQEHLNEEQFKSYQGLEPKLKARVDTLAGVHMKTKDPGTSWGIALGVAEKIAAGRAIRSGQRNAYKRETR